MATLALGARGRSLDLDAPLDSKRGGGCGHVIPRRAQRCTVSAFFRRPLVRRHARVQYMYVAERAARRVQGSGTSLGPDGVRGGGEQE